MERFRAGLPQEFWFLWMGTIVNRLGGFVVPFLSLYLTSQRGVPVGRAGLIVALFGAGSFAAQLVGGELADRLGRRPVLLMSLLGAPPLTLALGLSHNLALIGVLTAYLDSSRTCIGQRSTRPSPTWCRADSRPRAFGYMYWAINLGAAVAPVVAGFMAHINYLLLFVGDAVTTLVYGLIVLIRIRETRPSEAGHAAHIPIKNRMAQVGKEPVLLAFTFLTLLFGLIYMQGMVTLPLDMQNHGSGTIGLRPGQRRQRDPDRSGDDPTERLDRKMAAICSHGALSAGPGRRIRHECLGLDAACVCDRRDSVDRGRNHRRGGRTHDHRQPRSR